jgi:glycerate-2-kinase
LAKILYPATVVGLIFSDVPGNDWSHIASGPTYKDTSTVADAEAIIKKYSLGGGSTYLLKETPKEDIYFEKVTNIPLVSNQTALDAMAKKGRALGYNPVILSNALYESPERVRDMMFDRAEISHDPVLVLAGGEPSLQIPKQHGKGGRNEHLVLSALDRMSRIKNSSEPLFISIGSDGIDNTDAAGAIADTETLQKATALGLDPKAYLDAFDSYHFFEKTGDLVFTGSTGANVSDLMVVLQDEKK